MIEPMNAETQIHLLRHAHAGDPMKWSGPDGLRPLSERGRRQAEAMGELLARAGFRPDVIVSSPKVRALETARIVAAHLRVEARSDDDLASLADLPSLERLLDKLDDPARPLLVGHDPDFSELTAALAGTPDFALRKGALVRIDAARPLHAGSGLLRWLVPPELVTGSD
jgi:phosphohistidine phosphatase SixA